MKFEGNGDMDKNSEAIWMFFYLFLDLYCSWYGLWTLWEGPRENTVSAWIADGTASASNTARIQPCISISDVNYIIQKSNNQGQRLNGRWDFITNIRYQKGKVTKLNSPNLNMV